MVCVCPCSKRKFARARNTMVGKDGAPYALAPILRSNVEEWVIWFGMDGSERWVCTSLRLHIFLVITPVSCMFIIHTRTTAACLSTTPIRKLPWRVVSCSTINHECAFTSQYNDHRVHHLHVYFLFHWPRCTACPLRGQKFNTEGWRLIKI